MKNLKRAPTKCQTPECKGKMQFIISPIGNGVAWDSEKQYKNFAATPVTFRTKGDLQRHCKRNGLSSAALL